MCGISGYFNFRRKLSKNDLYANSVKMCNVLERRGPDSSGVWVDKSLLITFAHRRLSIIDLNKRSDQPMKSNNDRFIIVFNGEIFNFLELKDLLKKEGIKFRTNSDTEVIVESFANWGITESVRKFQGMFAIAAWDKRKKELFLIRDRLGIKPLYFYFDNGNFAFASEIKAIKELKWLNFEIDKKSLSSFVRLNYIPAPFSIYKKVKKLEPGKILKINLSQKIQIKSYWNFLKLASSNEELKLVNYENNLESLLEKKIKSHMISDVPLGVFLSGGIDSSLIALLSQKQSKNKINSFTIGFLENDFNESIYAKKIANYIGTNHSEVFFSYKEFKDLVDDVLIAYDEPFSDSSQLPTMLLSKVTKKKVSVALSGDGGDELFGGYYRYFIAEKYKRIILRKPKYFKVFIFNLINFFPVSFWNFFGRLFMNKYGGKQFGDKLLKLASILKEPSENKFFERIISNCGETSEVLKNSDERVNKIFDKEINKLFPSLTERMQVVDTLTYLPDDILTKVDRASMYHSLEVRVPFLDHEVVEYAFKLPKKLKVDNENGKIILKKILKKYLPNNLIDRPKMGFGIPLGNFIRQELRKELESFLYSNNLNSQGFFKIDVYRKKWREHLSGKRNWQFLLWNYYVFQKWLLKWN